MIPVLVPACSRPAILAFILAWNDFAFAVSFLETPATSPRRSRS